MQQRVEGQLLALVLITRIRGIKTGTALSRCLGATAGGASMIVTIAVVSMGPDLARKIALAIMEAAATM